MGEATCFRVKQFTSTTYLHCFGTLSCSGINENNKNGDNGASTKTVDMYGYGMYALKESWISGNLDIPGDVNNFYMYGFYSGFGAHLVCPSGHKCNLYCASSGCFNLTFDCDDSVSTCNVYYESSVSTFGDDNIYDAIEMIDVEEGYLLEYFKYTEPGNFYLENNVYAINTSGECDYTCMDTQSCQNSELVGDPSANLASLCCLASGSCTSSDISGWTNVYIDSSYAAVGLNITDITGVIAIRGRYGGEESTIKNFGTLFISASSGSQPITQISNGYYLGCFGSVSCQSIGLIEDIEYIVGTGYLSVANTTITTTTKTTIYLLGHESGFGSQIYCNSGAICHLYLWTIQLYNDIDTIECNLCQVLRIYDIENDFEIVYQEGTYSPTCKLFCYVFEKRFLSLQEKRFLIALQFLVVTLPDQ